MRWIATIGFAAGLLALTSVKAEASMESCTEGLLNAPAQYYEMLQVTSGQAAQLDSIRLEVSRRRAEFQHQLERARVQGLAQQQEWALTQLERETNFATTRMAEVLTTWQRERCGVQWEAPEPPPAAVVVRSPGVMYRVPPVVRRVPPRVVIRHPMRRPAPAPRYTVRHTSPRVALRPAPVRHRAPAYHNPPKAPMKAPGKKGHNKGHKK